MKIYSLKRLYWGIMGLLMLLSISPLVAQDTATVYTDPAQRFSADIPAGWTDESFNDYGRFRNADNLRAYLLAVTTDDIQAGIRDALAITNPDFEAEPVQSSTIPAPNGVWTQNIYALPDGSITMVVAQFVDGVAYLIILQSPDEGILQAASDDFNSLLLGFTIGEKIDLTGIQPRKFTPEMLAELENYIHDIREFYGVPGAAVAIVQDGEVIYSHGFGVREMGTDAAVTTDTLFMVGSIGKSMTTMMIGALVDEGVLDWDTAATDIFPDFSLSNENVNSQIRIRDFVNNASGVPTYDVPGFLAQRTPAQIIESLATVPMKALPGEEFNYSNLMFAVGGYAAARSVGAAYGNDLYDTYTALVRERIFDPIGMLNTTYDFDAAVAIENHASPHSFDVVSRNIQVTPIDLERFVVPIAPAGAPWSNIVDMGLYLTTQLNQGVAANGARVVSEASLNETQKPGVNVGGKIYYGMGWVIEDYNGIPLIWHNGGTLGFTSDLAFLPGKNLGVVTLNNKGNAENFNQSIREYVFELGFGLEHKADKRYRTAQVAFASYLDEMFGGMQFVQAEAADVTEYLGEYDMGLSVVYNEPRGLVLVTDYGDIPLFGVENIPGMFYTSNAFVIVFAEDTTSTIMLSAGIPNDPSQTVTLRKLS